MWYTQIRFKPSVIKTADQYENKTSLIPLMNAFITNPPLNSLNGLSAWWKQKLFRRLKHVPMIANFSIAPCKLSALTPEYLISAIGVNEHVT